MSAATPTRPQIGALRLLSIEDEADKIAGSLDSLRLEGHEIVSEAEASAARARLEDEDFDVLILDQRLADDDQGGAGIIRALKKWRTRSAERRRLFPLRHGEPRVGRS